jgi:hypothetical protein
MAVAFSSLGAALDFETVNSTVPVEGMAISNQYQAHFGMSFRRGDGGYPVIAKRGIPVAAFWDPSFNPPLCDDLLPADSRYSAMGNFFLADDGLMDSKRRVFLDFAQPVAQVGGYIYDVDSGGHVTITAFSDHGTNVLVEVIINAGDPGTGGSRSTPWSLSRATNDIQTVRLETDDNVGYDDFTSSFAPAPQSPATLELHMLAGIAVTGDVGRPYRIEYADYLTPTNWVGLTNLFLPSSPFLFIDTTSPNSPTRFYRAVSVP